MLVNKSFFWGLLIGLPFAYPGPPFYIVAFLAFLLALPDIKFPKRQDIFITSLLILLITFTFIAQIFSPFQSLISSSNWIVSGGFYLIFLFGFSIASPLNVIKGYCFSMTLLSIMMVFLFFFLKTYMQGILMFVYPESRMWAYGILPDWPNFMGFGLSLSFMLCFMVLKNNRMGIVNLVAALLTTSRIAILAVILFSLFKLRNRPLLISLLGILIIFILILIQQILQIDTDMLSQLYDRISKTGDREAGWSFLIYDLFLKSPFFGIGAVKISDLNHPPNFGSYHNSYLEVLVRFGILTFVPFLVVIFPWKVLFSKIKIKQEILLIILFTVISAFFQNIFKHPCYFMLYSVLLLNSEKLNEEVKKIKTPAIWSG